ncbi:DUF4831 family protein [Porphyromonas pogonae]|uniref:DUF4831 family protein n=1 Tax=Porphyromonas pogonae TaxID=867595 RepID=UPI002E77CDB7|nr:DUF4831 family protein [Porphyromonas pogonae]
MLRVIRFSYLLILLSLFSNIFFAQAQTNVTRFDASQNNDYGVVYSLPRTQLLVEAKIEKETYDPGPLADYAYKYLTINASNRRAVHYRLKSIKVLSKGVKDDKNQFIVRFDKKTVAPFVNLTDQGIIYSINGDKQNDAPTPQAQSENNELVTPPSLPQEYNLAGSQSKQAEIAAGYLFHVRESTMNIVTGDVESMPKDGQSMKLVLGKLKSEEMGTLRLFCGDTIRETITYKTEVEPEENIQDKVIFRFSPLLGAVAANDLGGAPVYFSMSVVERAPEMTEKEMRKHEKSLDGVVYNLPGSAKIIVKYEGKTYFDAKLPITQLGMQQSLTRKMFNDRGDTAPKVYFDVNTGAISEIKQ